MNPKSAAEDAKAKQLRNTLLWGAGTVAAAAALWQIGDPWLVEHFGTGAPWWAYLLLCMKFAGGIIEMVADDAALRRGARELDDGQADGAAEPAATGSLWPRGALSPDRAQQDFQASSSHG